MYAIVDEIFYKDCNFGEKIPNFKKQFEISVT